MDGRNLKGLLQEELFRKELVDWRRYLHNAEGRFDNRGE
jgi:hypothetical protein